MALAAGFMMAAATGAIAAEASAQACDPLGLAGTWTNVGRPAGSDLVSIHIAVACPQPGAVPAGREGIEISFVARCLRSECPWGSVAAEWGDAGPIILSAHLAQERFDRTIRIARPDSSRLSIEMISQALHLSLPAETRLFTMERTGD